MDNVNDGIKWLLSWRPSAEVSVGAVIFSTLGTQPLFLLLQYPQGHWDFVKGHKEKGESDEETLRRELLEETGIDDCRILDGFMKNISYSYTAKGRERESRQTKGSGVFVSKKVIYYLAQVKTHRVKISDEHVDFTWLPYAEASRRIRFVNSKNVLDSAFERLKQGG